MRQFTLNAFIKNFHIFPFYTQQYLPLQAPKTIQINGSGKHARSIQRVRLINISVAFGTICVRNGKISFLSVSNTNRSYYSYSKGVENIGDKLNKSEKVNLCKEHEQTMRKKSLNVGKKFCICCKQNTHIIHVSLMSIFIAANEEKQKRICRKKYVCTMYIPCICLLLSELSTFPCIT